ncbi:hypothetical protein [Vibrio rotiferianus]|uniref:hypothetical protein n=1 Tax=Vibrio rotiferianus TaxID=190895 RepID=UPI0039818644
MDGTNGKRRVWTTLHLALDASIFFIPDTKRPAKDQMSEQAFESVPYLKEQTFEQYFTCG